MTGLPHGLREVGSSSLRVSREETGAFNSDWLILGFFYFVST